MSVTHARTRVEMQTAREAWAAVRPRSSADALRSLPAWRLLEALPNEAAADSDPSSAPAIPTVEGFPLCTEDGRVQISASHAGASRAGATMTVFLLISFAGARSPGFPRLTAADAAQDAAVATAASQLIPALRQGVAMPASKRAVPVAPDGMPLFGYVPGFDTGRVVVAIGEMQNALGFARTGASIMRFCVCLHIGNVSLMLPTPIRSTRVAGLCDGD